MPCTDAVFSDIAPAVINHDMIVKAIDEQRPLGEAGRLSREKGYVMNEVDALRLEFLHILRVDHLWILTSLTKLSLSNNIIEKIENLDALEQLKELDLSFNEIEVIQNLDALTKLEILTLYSNRITVIENMATLKLLHIFSIGKNEISDRESVLYLRKFKKLRSVNMAENGCANETDFRVFISTFLPQISYYEYIRITTEERQVGLELFSSKLEEVKKNEQTELEADAREEEERLEAELHADSFVEFLGGRQLFDSLFEKDPEGRLFLQLEEIEEAYTEYEGQFIEITIKIFEVGQERYETRKQEVAQFFNCIDTAKDQNQKESQNEMETFLEKKEDVLGEIKHIQEESGEVEDLDFVEYTERMQDLADVYNDMLQSSWKSLMGLEMNLFDQLEETNLNFERNVTELLNSFIEETQGLFTFLRNFEQAYMERVTECLNNLHAMQNANEFLISDDLLEILEDKELIMNAVASSHDIHMQLIDGREDRLVTRAKQWLDKLVNNLQKNEITRNRKKVLEINHFLDCQREEFDEIHQDNKMFNADITAALGTM